MGNKVSQLTHNVTDTVTEAVQHKVKDMQETQRYNILQIL